MDILTASEAREKLYRLIDQAAESHEPVFIKGKRATAVLISEEDWRSISETLHLESIPGMKESILKASKEPLSAGKTPQELDW